MATKFVKISDNEIKFNFKDFNFLLVEQKRGVYGAGRAVQLYQLNGLEKNHIKEIAWTETDNNRSMEKSDAYYKERFTTLDGCKVLALNYLKKLL
jgi:hypothetical protein